MYAKLPLVSACPTSPPTREPVPPAPASPASWLAEPRQSDEAICQRSARSEHRRRLLTPPSAARRLGSKTVKWGYYDLTAPYVAHVKSGHKITIEVLTHDCGTDYNKMIKGDPGVESVYKWLPGQTTNTKAVPQWPLSGPHVVTGPIKICGAKAGDIVQVDILKFVPRKNPVTGKTFGANTMSPFGYHYSHGGHRNGTAFGPQDACTITVYEIVKEKKTYYAQPVYQFKVPSLVDPSSVVNPINDYPIGVIVPHKLQTSAYDLMSILCLLPKIGNLTARWSHHPCTLRAERNCWSKHAFLSTQAFVTLTNKLVTYAPGFQGKLATGFTEIVYTNATLDYRIPLRPHLGVMGVMPANGQNFLKGAVNGTRGANTVPPSKFGGNIDNWRVGKGTTMYYRAEVDGARFYVADTHASQGDGEISGTAVETSFTVTLRITLISQAKLPATIKTIDFPLGETSTEYFVHGFAYSDYLWQLPVPSTILPDISRLDIAFHGAYDKTRNFLMDAFKLTEEEAIGIMSTSVDFFVTQVVDSNWGVHGTVRKAEFAKRTQARRLLEYVGDSDLIEQMHHRAKLAARRRNSAIAHLWGKSEVPERQNLRLDKLLFSILGLLRTIALYWKSLRFTR
eukprot:SM000160S02523  [mRNA]  locus=s160:71:4872:+ [translate_table: standard]